jgi:hypothetical protein
MLKDGTARRRAAVVVGAIAVLAAASVPSVNAVDPEPVEFQADAGVLLLRSDPAGASITYSGPLDLPALTQTITTNSKCGATTTATLLSMTAMIGAANAQFGLGRVSNGFGVRGKNNCAVSEGRIGSGESITLALTNAFPADVTIAAVELDIEGKFGASLGVATDADAYATVTPYPLDDASDNGPDAGVGDNDRPPVVIGAGVRGLRLTATAGELSLEGGGDGTYAQYLATGDVGPIGTALGTADTVIKLQSTVNYDNAVDCLESVNATLIGNSATGASFTRLLNDGATDPDGCRDIGVTFEILDVGVSLEKTTSSVEPDSLGEPEAVNAQVEITWAPQTGYPLADVVISFTGDPADFETVQWCEGFVYAEDGTTIDHYIHPADARFPGGVLPWCLVSDDADVQEDGTVELVQVYDGAGDPLWATR